MLIANIIIKKKFIKSKPIRAFMLNILYELMEYFDPYG